MRGGILMGVGEARRPTGAQLRFASPHTPQKTARARAKTTLVAFVLFFLVKQDSGYTPDSVIRKHILELSPGFLSV